ncbi:glycerol dehydrogenase [Cupriavidus pauculus]|uniref:Glycerol dehydrogenase n=1 Tax=Cupriavidus pauculus TaxID=82633 RepID=A0A2N5C2L3_9BURK|nr:glycerol dehydrogenase [Cupriavidus pauculus]PLP96445.1 alcohol dehydrogenase [Cupriavidus pauculus]
MHAVFGSPGRYVQGAGAIEVLGEHAARLGRQALLVADRMVMDMVGERLTRLCEQAGVVTHGLSFDEALTPGLVERLAAQVGQCRPELVIAAGGGRSIDAGKALADHFGVPVMTVPTVASNDAPTSKNYVLYDDAHRLLAVRHLAYSPSSVIADTALIAQAPASMLLAGIGDAISKSFEAEQCARAPSGRNMFGTRPLMSAAALTRTCHAVLMADAADALAAAGTGKPTPAFERIVEATILMSGLGFESGGLSIAHALTRGLSALRQVSHAPHGLQVAFGLLVQLQLEGRDEVERTELEALYRQIGLPLCLADLGLPDATQDELRHAAELSLAAPHIHNFVRELNAADLVEAIGAVNGRAPRSAATGERAGQDHSLAEAIGAR